MADFRRDFAPINLIKGDTLEIKYDAPGTMTIVGITFHVQEEPVRPRNEPTYRLHFPGHESDLREDQGIVKNRLTKAGP
jgi:hypothetical protein